MNTLCVYCTRTGITGKIASEIAGRTGADTVMITNGKKYGGFFGYISAAVTGLKKRLPRLMPYELRLPLEEYDRIILAFPIWCEDACPFVKTFLSENRNSLKGELMCIATHMSGLSYEEKISGLSKYAGKEISSFLSVQTHKHDWLAEVEAFISLSIR